MGSSIKKGQVWLVEMDKQYIVRVTSVVNGRIRAIEYEVKVPKLFELNEDCFIELLEDV